MKTVSLLIVTLFLATAQVAYAQNDPNKVAATRTMLGEIDVANQILPLLLTKEQIKALLTTMEKCRQNVKNQERKEADRIRELAPEAEKVMAEALKGFLPPPEFIEKANKLIATFENERRGVIIANGLILVDSMKANLNSGQLKAAVGVVDKVFNEETKTWEDGTFDSKLRQFGLAILLSEHAYGFMNKLLAAK